jgi:membrane protein CcdC involved in cytochrome C biogenesis
MFSDLEYVCLSCRKYPVVCHERHTCRNEIMVSCYKLIFTSFLHFRSKFEVSDDMVFSELPIRRARKAMAQNFYSLLVLQKVMAVGLDQGDEFGGDITIRKGPNFETAVL